MRATDARKIPNSASRRLATAIVLTALLTAFSAAAAADGAPRIGEPVWELVASDAAATTVRVVFPVLDAPAAGWSNVDPGRIVWSSPEEYRRGPNDTVTELPRRAFTTLAVPTRARPRPVVVSARWLREPGIPASAGDLVSLGPPSISRGVPLVSVSVMPLAAGGGVLGEMVIRIPHAASEPYASRLARKQRSVSGEPEVFAASGVLNRSIYGALAGSDLDRAAAKAAASGHPFGMSDHWLRLEAPATGVYRITGYDTEMLGLSSASVDPSTLRLFQAWAGPLPEDPETAGSWQDGWDGMREVAIRLSDTDGVWSSADTLLFYGVGPDCWRERRDLFGGELEYVEHPYSDRHVYWLTWENPGTSSPHPGTPLRIGGRDAAPGSGEPLTVHRARRHFEESYNDAHGRVADNWAWDMTLRSLQSYPFSVDHVAADSAAAFRVEIRSTLTHTHASNSACSALAWVNDRSDGMGIAEREWTVSQEDDSDAPFLLEAVTDHLAEGENDLYLQRASPDTSPYLLLDSFDVVYWRNLVRDGGALEFVHWGGQMSEPTARVDLRIGSVQDVELACWDVTNPLAPIELRGEAAGGVLAVGVDRSSGTDLHCVAFGDEDHLQPASLTLRSPADLRGTDVSGLDYLLIYPSEFADAARDLADFRGIFLPGVDSPSSLAVNAREIYDSFGGGVKDPLALRNFIKWVYNHSDSGDGERLRYVCLFGDSSRDLRNRLNQQRDFLPTYVRTMFPNLLNNYDYEPYATDDHLVSFDNPIYGGKLDTPDISVGRLTVRSAEEARSRVDAIMQYALQPESGAWGNRLVIAADDLETPKPKYGETFHIRQAELLSNDYFAPTMDQAKIYLTEYEKEGAVKPGARRDLRGRLSDGVAFFHYIGHGSDNTLADEQLFITDDVYSLTNGDKRFVFLAFSCDVGIYDSPMRQSMGEIFTSQAEGGAIAAVTASQVSWSFPNNVFSSLIYASLYPDGLVDPDVTLGEAIFAAKQTGGDDLALMNSQRYMLLGDPALALPTPASGLELDEAGSDSLRGGMAERVVAVMSGSGLPSGPGVEYELQVQEAGRNVLHVGAKGDTISYFIPGEIAFRGTGPVEADSLEVSFKVPQQLRFGDRGRMRLTIDAGTSSHAASVEVPVVRSDLGEASDVVGPQVDLGFEDGRYRVKAGTLLVAGIRDSSGINILATNPSNSILLEFDENGLATDVSADFVFDPGSYSEGRLSIPLPADLELGPHRAAVFASDMLGNVGSDTLSFQMVAATVTAIEGLMVFPNPTPGSARMVFDLTDPMRVQWDLFTVSGRRVRHLERNYDSPGRQTLYWDGFDQAGDRPANGVYIFVLKGSGAGDGHVVTETGQLVIMR